jgi:gliding motility-associated-like protein
MKIIFSFLFVFCLFLSSKSAHIVGGSMTYTCLGGNTYEVTLKLYRDCFSGGALFDEPAYLSVFDDNFDLVELDDNTFSGPIITLLDPNGADSCNITPIDICVEEGVYTKIIELPDNITGFYLVYQRCCRNATIINLEFPADQGNSVVAYIPSGEVVECNNSSVYNNFPPLRICINNPLVFDHSATDVDGDSLVYRLCAPFLGASSTEPQPTIASNPPYDPLNYSTGFSAEYPLASNPALAIDAETGLLTGTPNQLGQFVVGICVNEYREGIFVTESKRDFQFNVTDCINGILAEIDGIENEFGAVLSCNGLTVTFNNNSVNANAYFWDFGIDGIESDTSTAEFPTYTFPDYGVYNITLIAKNPCLSDTATKPFLISFTPPAEFETSINCNQVDFTNLSPDSLQYFWSFGDGITSIDFSPSHLYAYGTQTTVQLLVTNSDGCQFSFSQDIEIIEAPTAQFDVAIDCLEIEFLNQSENSTSYFWSFGDGQSSTSENPIHTYSQAGEYTVTLTSSNTCTDQIIFFVFEVSGPPLANFSIDQICNRINFQNQSQGGSDYTWNFGDNTLQSIDVNPIHYYQFGVYEVSLIAFNNCGTDTLLTNININNIPNALCSAEIFCDSVVFTNTTQNATSYLWQFGDGSTDSSFTGTNTYNLPGNYNINLFAFDSNGCSDTLEIQLTIPEKPIAIFEDSILCNLSSFENLSVNSLNYSWNFGDGQISIESNPQNLYAGQGNYLVTLTAYGNENCESILKKIIVLENPVLDQMIVPNTFSPNNDNYNELFEIANNNDCYDYNFKIYNRWGQLIHNSTNNRPAWDGKFKGKSIEPGVYFYTIESNGSQRKGSLNLFR